MKEQRIPLLISGDEELAQIAAAFEIPEVLSSAESFQLPWRSCLPYVCIASIGAFLFGYHCGVLNAILQFVAQDLGIVDDAFAQGWVVSMSLVGGLLGCMWSGTIADELGRRRAAQLSTLPIILGGCFSAMARSLSFMNLGRFLVGLGLALGASASSLYVSEISPGPLRGTFGAIGQISSCLGLLGSYCVGLPAAIVVGWWRVCFWIASVPAALLLLGFEFCPESPRWLYKQSRWYEAEMAIQKLWGVSNFKAAIADLVRGNNTESASFAELCNEEYVRVISKGAAIFVFQQFAGISAIILFSSTLFRDAGIKSNLAASVCVGFVNLFASCIATCLIDRLGRKTLLMWSFFGMAVGMAVQSCAVALPFLSRIEADVLLFGTLLYVLMYGIGVGPVPMILLPEMYPGRIRAKAMAVSFTVLTITTGVVGMLYLPVHESCGDLVVFIFFAIISLCGMIFVRACIVETRGRSLEEIEATFFGGSSNH